MKLVFAIAFIIILTYLLWTRGLLVINSKIAVVFVGRRGENHWGAGVTSCTGFTKRVLPLERGKQYRFILEHNITSGNITVEIACGKNVVRTFDKINVSSTLNAGDGIYIVTTRFRKASGEYLLKWEEV